MEPRDHGNRHFRIGARNRRRCLVPSSVYSYHHYWSRSRLRSHFNRLQMARLLYSIWCHRYGRYPIQKINSIGAVGFPEECPTGNLNPCRNVAKHDLPVQAFAFSLRNVRTRPQIRFTVDVANRSCLLFRIMLRVEFLLFSNTADVGARRV